MAAKIVVEAIVYSLVYSVFMLGLFKVQGARKQLYNYPPAIQKRAIERGITTQEEMNANAKRNKVIGLIGAGFIQSYIFFNAFSLFDALVIDSIWFCHGTWWVIPGTEDMTEAYHDYAFHWKWFFLSLVMSLPLAVIVGGIVALI